MSTFSVLLQAQAGPRAGAVLVVSVVVSSVCWSTRRIHGSDRMLSCPDCCSFWRRRRPDLTLLSGTHSTPASRHTPFALLELTVTGFVAHRGSGLENARGRPVLSTGGFRGRVHALRLWRPG